ncbi:MAG TPA: MazG-like family protein [Tissierellaceae bacterium]|nr:MazG-like family protein [Tissierellaceae bacterium]
MSNPNIDIARNMKTIEWLKVELLSNIAYLHKVFVNNDDNTKEDLEDIISNIILQSYILGKRLGIDYEEMDSALQENIKLNLIKEHKLEKWYGDISQLLEYIQAKDK